MTKQQPKSDLIETVSAWFEQRGPALLQDWRRSIDATRDDVRERIREAAAAVLRYTDDPELSESLRLAQLTELIRALQQQAKNKPDDIDWLSNLVDGMIIATDEQKGLDQPALSNGDHVVLLHGLTRSNLSFVRMEQNLVNHGFRVTNINYPSTKFSGEELVEQFIAPCLQDPLVQSAPNVHFVTHSLGGILTRYLLQHHQIDNLGRVVMLSPPNNGSEIVDVFRKNQLYKTINGPVGQQLGTDANSMPRQLGPVDFELGVITGNRTVDPIFSIMIKGENDGKVSAESTQVQGMKDFIIVPHSHTFIMHSRLVIAQTLQFLQNGRFDHTAVEKSV